MTCASTSSIRPPGALDLPIVRFGLALALSFFPVALLYPLSYPGRELVTISAWILAFPSRLLFLSVSVFGILAVMGHQFYAYNLFCLLATLGIALAITKKRVDDLSKLLTIARTCILLTVFIAAWQAISPAIWLQFFPDLQGLGDGRGAGLRTEPSYLAAPLALYLSLLVRPPSGLKGRWPPIVEAVFAISAVLGLTRSLSVLIVALCFLPALSKKLVYAAVPGLAAVGVAAMIFYGRVTTALGDASGDVLSLITSSIGSWRNIPDIAILANYESYLLPGNPADVRELLNVFATAWSPEFSWVENTFSLFSASATTVGLILTGVIFVSGFVLGLKRMLLSVANLRLAWILLYFASWFFVPKFEACSWIAIAFLATTPPEQDVAASS